MTKTLLTALVLLACLLSRSALAGDDSLPAVGLPDADPNILLTYEEWKKAEWYIQDVSTGAVDSSVRMNCGSKEMRSMTPAAYPDLTAQEVSQAGYLNICVPVQTGFQNLGGMQRFKGDPPVYLHADFNRLLNVIFPDLYAGLAGRDVPQISLWVETEDPVTGEKSVEYKTFTLSSPDMTMVVELIDGFGQVRIHKERKVTATDWTPKANARLEGSSDDPLIHDLRSVLIDPRLPGRPNERWTPYRNPPMMITAGLRANSVEGWSKPLYISYGVAILVPTTGIEALAAPTDLGWWIDAATGRQHLDWTPVEGAVGYKVVHTQAMRTFINPYLDTPEGYLMGRWWPDDFLSPPETPLYSAPGVPITHTWTDVGSMGIGAGDGYFVVPVGPPVESFGGQPLAGRPSRLIRPVEGSSPVRLPDGSFRLGGATIHVPASGPEQHGFDVVARNGLDTIRGFGFGDRGGQLSEEGGVAILGDRVHRWTDTLVEWVSGSTAGDLMVVVEDSEGVTTPIHRRVIDTIPAFSEPSQSWFVPGESFVVMASTAGQAPTFELLCDSGPHGLYVPEAATVQATGISDSWNVTIDYDPGSAPCYRCHCVLESPVEAADGVPMSDPFWRWPMTPVPAPSKTHVVAYILPEGEEWMGGGYGSALFGLGVDTGSGIENWPVPAGVDAGPTAVVLRQAKSLSWSFGDLGTSVLTATDRKAIEAVLGHGGNVILVGLHFLAALADEPGHFARDVLGLEGVRPVRLRESLQVPTDSPAYPFLGGEVALREECWNRVAHAPNPGPGCTVVMTTKTSKGQRPVVVSCGGSVLISALRSDCFWDVPVFLAWFSSLNWE